MKYSRSTCCCSPRALTQTTLTRLVQLVERSANRTRALCNRARAFSDQTRALSNQTGHVPTNRSGACSLSIAAGLSHTDALKLLISAGANVELRDVQGTTPLIVAAAASHTEAVRALYLYLCCLLFVHCSLQFELLPHA